MNLPANRRPQKLIAILSSLLLAAAVGFGAPVTSVVTVEIIGNGTVNPNYDGQTLTNGNKYSMTAKPRAGFAFTGWTGSLTSLKPKLTFTNSGDMTFIASFADVQKPALSITVPPGSTALTNADLIVTGKAKDNAAVTNVFCSFNGGD
ncbi:MAG TPA: hypothetical protein VGI63_09465, partial [Verrucomicrobiae bacterium]